MTRIGKVTVKLDDAAKYMRIVLKHVIEDGEITLAKFEFEGWRFRRIDGSISDFAPHAQYRRVA